MQQRKSKQIPDKYDSFQVGVQVNLNTVDELTERGVRLLCKVLQSVLSRQAFCS